MTIKDYIVKECIDTDMQCVLCERYTENDIIEFYKDIPMDKLLKVYDEYYGIDTLLNLELKED